MNKFGSREVDDTSKPWKEWCVQAYIVQELRKDGYLVHGDGNGLSLSPRGIAQKTVCGAQKGWPDLTILLPNGITLFIELKVSAQISPEQNKLHSKISTLGHNISVVRAKTPHDGLQMVYDIIKMHIINDERNNR